MNDKITKLALDAGLMNYVDGETPRHYFVSGNAELEEVQRFAELIIQEFTNVCKTGGVSNSDYNTGRLHCVYDIKKHFEIK
jgi:hypothetical protein